MSDPRRAEADNSIKLRVCISCTVSPWVSETAVKSMLPDHASPRYFSTPSLNRRSPGFRALMRSEQGG
jgi:hypothetical protein